MINESYYKRVMKRLLFIVVLLTVTNFWNLLAEGSRGILKATKLGITVRPGAPVYATHETTSKTIHSLNLWDVVYVIDGSMEEAERLPVGSERNRLYGYKVFLPFSPGKWGWVKYNHVRELKKKRKKRGQAKNNNGGMVIVTHGGDDVTGGVALSTDEMAEIFIRSEKSGGPVKYLNDLHLMSTDDFKAALKSGNYTKSTKWAYSTHKHHWYPEWLGGKKRGVKAKIRGFEHITDLEPELFEYVKKHIPLIKRRSAELYKLLKTSGMVSQEKITKTLFNFYKTRYPNLPDEVIMDALKKGVK